MERNLRKGIPKLLEIVCLESDLRSNRNIVKSVIICRCFWRIVAGDWLATYREGKGLSYSGIDLFGQYLDDVRRLPSPDFIMRNVIMRDPRS